MGIQQITRWGMLSEDKSTLAELLCRVLMDGKKPESVKKDVVAFRAMFQELRLVF
ncbi:MAG TPA: hypothetical protein VEH81_05310 [Ktedonobacteraceae bacterium]|nr:hypothetical protein [Ktedonobacteraceae bacterium]